MAKQIIKNEEDAIRLAVEAGYGKAEWHKTASLSQLEWAEASPAETFSDPAFWQALGKARGWGYVCKGCGRNSKEIVYGVKFLISAEHMCNAPLRLEIDEWKYHALRYFETLLSGGDMKAFLESLP